MEAGYGGGRFADDSLLQRLTGHNLQWDNQLVAIKSCEGIMGWCDAIYLHLSRQNQKKALVAITILY